MSQAISLRTHLLEALSASSTLVRYVQSPDFWPVAVKGGAENTLRDMMLADLNAAAGPLLDYTGERSRLDIVAYERRLLEELKPQRGPLPIVPSAAVELKFNFVTQRSQLRRAADGLVEMEARLGRDGALGAVQFVCEIWRADRADAALLARYGAHRTLGASSSLLDEYLAALPGTGKAKHCYVPWFQRYELRSSRQRAPAGCLAAIVWWPSRQPWPSEGIESQGERGSRPRRRSVTPRGEKP